MKPIGFRAYDKAQERYPNCRFYLHSKGELDGLKYYICVIIERNKAKTMHTMSIILASGGDSTDEYEIDNEGYKEL